MFNSSGAAWCQAVAYHKTARSKKKKKKKKKKYGVLLIIQHVVTVRTGLSLFLEEQGYIKLIKLLDYVNLY